MILGTETSCPSDLGRISMSSSLVALLIACYGVRDGNFSSFVSSTLIDSCFLLLIWGIVLGYRSGDRASLRLPLRLFASNTVPPHHRIDILHLFRTLPLRKQFLRRLEFRHEFWSQDVPRLLGGRLRNGDCGLV